MLRVTGMMLVIATMAMKIDTEVAMFIVVLMVGQRSRQRCV